LNWRRYNYGMAILKRWNMPSGWKFSNCLKKKARSQIPLSKICSDPENQSGMERLAQYIIRAPISQESMRYVPASEASDNVARVIYQSKDCSSSKTFLALNWLAQLVTHIPNKGGKMVRYDG